MCCMFVLAKCVCACVCGLADQLEEGGGGGATDCQIANLKDSCTSVPQHHGMCTHSNNTLVCVCTIHMNTLL